MEILYKKQFKSQMFYSDELRSSTSAYLHCRNQLQRNLTLCSLHDSSKKLFEIITAAQPQQHVELVSKYIFWLHNN